MKTLIRPSSIATLSAAIIGLACNDAAGPGQFDNPFEWRGQVAVGDAIEIKNIVGNVVARRATGTQVVVEASKDGDRDNPDEVRIVVVEHDDGVTICAVYPDVPGQLPNVCEPGEGGRLNAADNDVRVTFTVSVPVGVEFVGRSISGSIQATDLASVVWASTVSGNVDISTTLIAEAFAVSGSINVVIGEANWDRDLEFVTVSGNVAVEVPAATNAVATLSTVSGTVSSDFALQETSPGTWRGTLGSGERNLRLTTVSGNVALFRGA